MPSETPGAGRAEPQFDWETLARYLAGESPAAERDAVRQWLVDHPADARLLGELNGALTGLSLKLGATENIDVEAALTKVNARRSTGGNSRPVIAFPTRSSARWMPMAIAAALILAIGTVVLRGRESTANDVTTIAARTFTTGIGGRDSLLLPDGSDVLLGPGSRLTLAAGYGQQGRNVVLEGEAYFDVRHDSAKPFTVTANGVTIRDVGTSFGVHADSMGRVRVAVRSGAVQLSRSAVSSAQHATLNAGDVGVVAVTGEIETQRGAVTDDDLAWTQGKLTFRDATIAEVRDDLRRWYGIELVMTDSAILQRHLTATFDIRDSVGSVLKNIALSLPATIERHRDTAIVRPASETRRRK